MHKIPAWQKLLQPDFPAFVLLFFHLKTQNTYCYIAVLSVKCSIFDFSFVFKIYTSLRESSVLSGVHCLVFSFDKIVAPAEFTVSNMHVCTNDCFCI